MRIPELRQVIDDVWLQAQDKVAIRRYFSEDSLMNE